MENLREAWKDIWNGKAQSENMFVQIGRSSYSPLDFLLMVKDICKSLDFNKEDIVLDAGGGAGWVSISVAPFVNKVVLFDFSEKMIDAAKENTKFYENVELYHDDLLVMNNVKDKKYAKVIISSVIQYLEDYAQIETALTNIYNVLTEGGKAVFTHNPDMRKRQAHIDSYSRLDWPKEKINAALAKEEERLWLEIDELRKTCSKIGFSEFYEVPINPKLWQSTHMLDFVVKK